MAVPKLPTGYGPRQTPSVNRSIVGSGETGQVEQALANNPLAQIGAARQEAADRLSYAQAKSNYLVQQSKILSSLDDDDYETYEERYGEASDKALMEASESLRGMDQQLFLADMRMTAERGRVRSTELARVKEREYGLAGLESMIAQSRSAALESEDEIRRLGHIEAIHEAIDGAAERGYLDERQRGAMRRQVASDIARSSIDIMPPAERIEALDGTLAGFLDADERTTRRRKAQNQLERERREARHEMDRIRRVLQQDLKGRVKDATAAYLNGLEPEDAPTRAEFLAAYPEDGAERYDAFQDYADLGLDMQLIVAMAPDELNEFLQEKTPEPGEGYADAQQRYEALVKAAVNLDKRKQDDPAAYVNQYGQFDPISSLAEQERIGVLRPRVLTNAQADSISSAFWEPEADPSALLMGLEEEYGDLWPTIFPELDLPPAALVISHGVAPSVARTLSQIAPVKTSELRSVLPSGDASLIDAAVQGALAEFHETLTLNPGGMKTAATVQSETERLAYHYRAMRLPVNEAAERAASETVRDHYTFKDTYRVPIAYDADLIEDALEDIPVDLSVIERSGVFTDEFNDELAQAIWDNANWVTNADETGLQLVHGHSVLAERSFEELIGREKVIPDQQMPFFAQPL